MNEEQTIIKTMEIKPEDFKDLEFKVDVQVCPSDPAEANLCDSCQ